MSNSHQWRRASAVQRKVPTVLQYVNVGSAPRKSLAFTKIFKRIAMLHYLYLYNNITHYCGSHWQQRRRK